MKRGIIKLHELFEVFELGFTGLLEELDLGFSTRGTMEGLRMK